MTNETNETNDTPASEEEIRREMRSRFDAVNAEAEIRHQKSRAVGDIKEAEEKTRRAKRDSAAVENDSSGG